MATNKVTINTENGEEVLIDLTEDSVTPETLAEGETAHDASGALIVGTATPVTLVHELGESETAVMSQKAINDLKNSGELNGERGTGILKVTTSPTSYTTETGGKTPIRRMALSTIMNQASVDEVLVGDCISYSYNLYHIYYLDATYAYIDVYQSIRGTTGATGADGADGTSVTVSSVSESTEDGGSNVVTFSDGKTLTVKNGTKGSKGDTGDKGEQGEKGDPYVLTEADKAEIVQLVIESLGGNPVFGYIDEDNNVILSGNLTDGSYSVKYEMEDGSTVDIGDLVLDSNTYYSITSNLTNCTNGNSANEIVEGESYSATISANSGYEISSIVVTMGGTDISSTAVSGENITIENVTGNIVITAVAEETVVAPNYTNLFVPSEATINNRLNSSAAVTAQDGYVITNFIDVSEKTPFTADTKIYVKSAILNDDGKSRIFTYLTTGTEYTGMQSTVQTKSMTLTDEGNGVLSMSGLATAFSSGTKRCVMCLKISDTAITTSDIADLVITIDEPIE